MQMMLRCMNMASIVLLLMHMVCVGADYTFEARMESYQNPTHSMEPNANCCDGVDASGACTDPCDNTFIFCIQKSNSTVSNLITSPDPCPFLLHVSRVFEDNDDITFSVNEDLGDGVSNPLTFSRNGTWPGGVRFFVRPRDSDPSTPPPIIGTLFPVVEISAGSDFTTMTFTSNALLTMTVSFRVMCTGNSMGPDCSICREGFQNPGSGCTETCTPAQGCSPVGGFCNATNVCVCREGYSGDSCDIDLNPCVPTTPCQNGGTCMTTGPDQFECQCVEGYEGVNCELVVTDECDPNPCLNGATCSDHFQVFECECVEGYEGDTCEVEINECDPNPCQNGGTCNDLLADYNCSCTSGFTGRNCEMEEEEALVLVTVLLAKRRQKTVTVTGVGRQQDTMEIKPNPGYGISLQLTSSQQSPGDTEYYNGMGPGNDYDYVVEAGTTICITTKSNPAYAIPLTKSPHTQL